MKEIPLGVKAKDVISGFEGTVVAFCRYLTGCHQVLLIPKTDKEGKKIDGEWIDAQRIQVIDETRVVLPNPAIADGSPAGDITPPNVT